LIKAGAESIGRRNHFQGLKLSSATVMQLVTCPFPPSITLAALV
jgi:hypothetical protein